MLLDRSWAEDFLFYKILFLLVSSFFLFSLHILFFYRKNDGMHACLSIFVNVNV